MINSPDTVISLSPYRSGADRGLIFGLYFTLIFIFWVAGAAYPSLSLLTLALIAGFPFLTYRFLRKANIERNGSPETVWLWVHGIAMIFCGAILCAAVQVIYLKWINPDFMAMQLRRAVELYNSNPDPSLAQMAQMSQAILDNHAVPSASTITLTLWLFTVSSGSMLAGLMALVVKLRGLPRHRLQR